MNSIQRQIQNLHELLSDEYRKQPYVTTDNLKTRGFWAEIWRLEALLADALG